MILQEASFSLAEAKFAAGGDFNQAVLQNVNKVQIYIVFVFVFVECQQGQNIFSFCISGDLTEFRLTGT